MYLNMQYSCIWVSKAVMKSSHHKCNTEDGEREEASNTFSAYFKQSIRQRNRRINKYLSPWRENWIRTRWLWCQVRPNRTKTIQWTLKTDQRWSLLCHKSSRLSKAGGWQTVTYKILCTSVSGKVTDSGRLMMSWESQGRFFFSL